jgi:hypothetical protein
VITWGIRGGVVLGAGAMSAASAACDDTFDDRPGARAQVEKDRAWSEEGSAKGALAAVDTPPNLVGSLASFDRSPAITLPD